MFKRHSEVKGKLVPVTLDGSTVEMLEGDNLAAQLLLLDIGPLRRTMLSGSARAPHCMIGNCFDCLVEIDGSANQRSCMTEVSADMTIRRQLAD